MSDAELLERRRANLEALFATAPIKHLFGMTLRYDPQGCAIFELPYNPGLDHALGGTHGGAIATLLDNAGWFTVAPHFERWIATVEFSVRLHQPVSGQHLVSRGQVVRLGRRLSVARMQVCTLDGTLVATGAGTFTVTGVER